MRFFSDWNNLQKRRHSCVSLWESTWSLSPGSVTGTETLLLTILHRSSPAAPALSVQPADERIYQDDGQVDLTPHTSHLTHKTAFNAIGNEFRPVGDDYSDSYRPSRQVNNCSTFYDYFFSRRLF